MEIAQIIDMHDEIDSSDSLMEQHIVPEEYLSRLSDLLSRIDCVLRGLDVVSDQPTPKETLPSELTIEDSLTNIEKRVSQIESESEAFIEIISLSSNILRELDQIARAEATIPKVVDQIPEKKSNLECQTSQLRDYASGIRRQTKSKPEFKSLHSSLSSLRVLVLELKALTKAENNMGKIASTFILKAWVPATSLNQVMSEIKRITHGKCLIVEELPESDEIVPTIIKPVPRFFEGFEKISFSLGNPTRGETNPIWFTAITFPLLFGFMFADVGQGAILLALGVVLAYFRGRVDIDKISDIKRFLLMGSGLLVLCGLSAIFFGFLFGDFFGPSGVIPPILLDPMHEPARLLRFAIVIGVIMLSSSLALRIYNNVKNKLSNPAFISVCWLWLLLGGFFMWIYWGGISNVTMWFGEGLIMFSFLIIFPVVLMLAVTALTKSVMEGLELSIETFIETLSHTISFSRLAALCLVHTALNQLFLLLAGSSGHGYPTISLQSIPLIMVGTVLAITIEGLIIFTHCLRLHWVEILPKFYSGKGIPFKPLSLNGSNLIEDKNNGP